jgi:hypothetical protein
MREMRVKMRWGRLGAALFFSVFVVVGCVGDDPAADGPVPQPNTGGDDAGGSASDGGIPPLAPDAAPPAFCPLGCLPPAPAGWTGPSAIFQGEEANKPSDCPAPYTQLLGETHEGLSAAPAQCSCGTASLQGAKCRATIQFWSNSACNGGLPVSGGAAHSDAPCTKINEGAYGYLKLVTPTLTPGTCSYPNPTKIVPDGTFASVDVACGLPQKAACDGRDDCVASPLPDAPFTRLCIHKDGDESCPSEDYAKRFVAYKQVADTRDCTTCTGTPTGGACGSRYGFTGQSIDCGVVLAPTTHDVNTCYPNPGIDANLNAGALSPTGITCAPSGGEPTGAATSDEPVTYCCNR